MNIKENLRETFNVKETVQSLNNAGLFLDGKKFNFRLISPKWNDTFLILSRGINITIQSDLHHWLKVPTLITILLQTHVLLSVKTALIHEPHESASLPNQREINHSVKH